MYPYATALKTERVKHFMTKYRFHSNPFVVDALFAKHAPEPFCRKHITRTIVKVGNSHEYGLYSCDTSPTSGTIPETAVLSQTLLAVEKVTTWKYCRITLVVVAYFAKILILNFFKHFLLLFDLTLQTVNVLLQHSTHKKAAISN